MNNELFEQKLEMADEILGAIMHNYVHHLDETPEKIKAAFARLKSHINEAELLLLQGTKASAEETPHLANTTLGEVPHEADNSTGKEPAGVSAVQQGPVRQNEQIQKDCTTCRHLTTCEPFEEPCFSCTTLDNTFSLWEVVQSE